MEFIFSVNFNISIVSMLLKLILRPTERQQITEIDRFKKAVLCFSVKYKLGTKSYSNCTRAAFVNRFYCFFLLRNDCLWRIHKFLKKKILKKSFQAIMDKRKCVARFTFSAIILYHK